MASIQGIYIALFGRPADPAGLSYFNTLTRGGADLSTISSLSGQPEYLSRFSGLTSGDIVNAIFKSLFGRDAEKAGLDFFVSQLDSGKQSINTIAINILDGAKGSDQVILQHKIAAADLFTASLDLPSEIKAYVGDAAAALGRQFISGITATHEATPADIDKAVGGLLAPAAGGDSGPSLVPTFVELTTDTDNLTAAVQLVTYTATLGGASPTLNDNDSLHGKSSTLEITDTEAGARDLLPSGVSLTGISGVSLTTAGNAGTDAAHAFDLSGFTGITRFKLDSSGAAGDFIKLGAGAAATVVQHGASTVLAVDGDFASLDITSAALASLSLSGHGGTVASIAAPALTSLTVTGAVTLGTAAAPIVLAANAAVSVASDTAALHLAVSGTGAAGADGTGFDETDRFLVGKSGDDGANQGNETLVFGDGDNSLVLNAIASAGGNGASIFESRDSTSILVGGNGGAGGLVINYEITMGNGDNRIDIDTIGGKAGDAGEVRIGSDEVASSGRSTEGGYTGTGKNFITLGDGNNIVTDNSRGGDGGAGGNITGNFNVVYIGSGSDGGSGGGNSITVGNGDNTIIDHSTGGNGGRVGTFSGVAFSVASGPDGHVGSSGADRITVGTGDNMIDLGGHGNDVVALGTNASYDASALAANQTITNAGAGTLIKFALSASLRIVAADATHSGTGSLQAILEDCQAGISQAGGNDVAASMTFNGNTYIVESHSGYFGATDTVIVEITGIHDIGIAHGNIVLLT